MVRSSGRRGGAHGAWEESREDLSGAGNRNSKQAELYLFRLGTEKVSVVQGLVDKHPELADSAAQLLHRSLAEATLKGNECEITGGHRAQRRHSIHSQSEAYDRGGKEKSRRNQRTGAKGRGSFPGVVAKYGEEAHHTLRRRHLQHQRLLAENDYQIGSGVLHILPEFGLSGAAS